MSIFNDSERELIDAARMVLSDGIRRLSERPSLFPTNRANTKADRQAAIDARNALCDHLIASYGPLRYEVAVACLIDAQGRLITIEEFPRGGTAHCPISFRILAGWICSHGADSVILAHNHPSGDSTPSRQDKDLTSKLASWVPTIDCRLVEHYVVTVEEAVGIIGGF